MTTSAMTQPETFQTTGLVSVDGRTYPLKSARVEARAEGGVGFTAYSQIYANPYKEPLEVLYTLPLPADGAVVGYEIRLGERVIRGEVRKRSEAREEYRKALLEGRTAAMLEQNRANTFTQKLGSLPPGTAAEIRIEVLHRLAFLPSGNGETPQWEYRFPTVVGVRYEGADGQVPDAEKLDVDRGATDIPVRLEASLLVADGNRDSLRPTAPWREIIVEDLQEGVRIALKDKVRLDRDLVLRWNASREEVGIRIVEGGGLACDKGRYVLATITPPAMVRKGFARDLTLLIDASGSMSGRPLEHAKMVCVELLRSLDPGDRFQVLAFANSVEQLVPVPTGSDEKNLTKAIAAINRLAAGGGTEMTQAMVKALEPLRSNSQRQVILLSDGQIGFEGEVIGAVLGKLVPGARLHAVGIGSAPNRALTRGVARAGRGVEILVGDDDDARAASRRLLQATVHPVLTDIEAGGSALIRLAPSRPQDVLAGQPLVLLAEVSDAGGELEIRGKAAGTSEAWTRRIGIPAKDDHGAASLPASSLPLGALFGREAIEDQELEISAARGGLNAEEFERKIEDLGLRHGIASRKTSLIAISESRTVNPLDPRRRERLPVELPAEVSAEGVGLLHVARQAPLMASMAMMEEEFSLGFRDVRLAESARERVFWHLSSLRREKRKSVSEIRVEVRKSRILHLDRRTLVLEFEVPVDGLLLPSGRERVAVDFLDGDVHRGSVIQEQSSALGPHKSGLTVRLAIRLDDHPSWHVGPLVIRWGGEVRAADGERGEGTVEVHVEIGTNS